MRAVSKPQKHATSEEVLLHGDSINFTAARVSDKPGCIRITSAQIEDYKTVEPVTGLRSATPRKTTISRSLRVAFRGCAGSFSYNYNLWPPTTLGHYALGHYALGHFGLGHFDVSA